MLMNLEHQVVKQLDSHLNTNGLFCCAFLSVYIHGKYDAECYPAVMLA